MTNQEAMRVKYFLEAMIDFHGKNRVGSDTAIEDKALRETTRSVGLGLLSESALDLLGSITWPDEVKHETA